MTRGRVISRPSPHGFPHLSPLKPQHPSIQSPHISYKSLYKAGFKALFEMSNHDAELLNESEEVYDDFLLSHCCVCNKEEHGLMVSCDNETCAIQWFHAACVGLSAKTVPEGSWICPPCSGKLYDINIKFTETTKKTNKHIHLL